MLGFFFFIYVFERMDILFSCYYPNKYKNTNNEIKKKIELLNFLVSYFDNDDDVDVDG
jgi:hypothetical protein